MGIGASVLLLAIGAILAFAVSLDPTPLAGMSIEWETVGVILMVAGAIGLAWSIAVMSRLRRRDEERMMVERERIIDPR